MFSNGIDTLQSNTQDGYETDEIEEEEAPTTPAVASKKKTTTKPPPPRTTLIVEVRSGCLDPDDIYTVLRTEASDAGIKRS